MFKNGIPDGQQRNISLLCKGFTIHYLQNKTIDYISLGPWFTVCWAPGALLTHVCRQPLLVSLRTACLTFVLRLEAFIKSRQGQVWTKGQNLRSWLYLEHQYHHWLQETCRCGPGLGQGMQKSYIYCLNKCNASRFLILFLYIGESGLGDSSRSILISQI